MTVLSVSRPTQASAAHRRRPSRLGRPIRVYCATSDDSDFIYMPDEDQHVPPTPAMGPNFWPNRVRVRLPARHVAYNNRAAQLEILAAIEHYARCRPTNNPMVDDLHSNYLGVITTGLAGGVSPRSWELWRDGEGFEIIFRCRGPLLWAAQRRSRILDPSFYLSRDRLETTIWMSVYGHAMTTPPPPGGWDQSGAPTRNN